MDPSTHLWNTLGATSAWTRLADTKALLALIADVLVVGTMVQAVLANPAGHAKAALVTAGLTIALGAASGFLALAAAIPSFDDPKAGPPLYFAGIARYGSSDLYRIAVGSIVSSEDACNRELVNLIYSLARSGVRKHHRVRWALWFLTASFVVGLVTLLLV